MNCGPLTFQCACLHCVCRSIASARRALRIAMTFVRVASDMMLFLVGYMASLLLSANSGRSECLPSRRSQACERSCQARSTGDRRCFAWLAAFVVGRAERMGHYLACSGLDESQEVRVELFLMRCHQAVGRPRIDLQRRLR